MFERGDHTQSAYPRPEASHRLTRTGFLQTRSPSSPPGAVPPKQPHTYAQEMRVTRAGRELKLPDPYLTDTPHLKPQGTQMPVPAGGFPEPDGVSKAGLLRPISERLHVAWDKVKTNTLAAWYVRPYNTPIETAQARVQVFLNKTLPEGTNLVAELLEAGLTLQTMAASVEELWALLVPWVRDNQAVRDFVGMHYDAVPAEVCESLDEAMDWITAGIYFVYLCMVKASAPGVPDSHALTGMPTYRCRQTTSTSTPNGGSSSPASTLRRSSSALVDTSTSHGPAQPACWFPTQPAPGLEGIRCRSAPNYRHALDDGHHRAHLGCGFGLELPA
ncbi:hypothetical protein EXIGLDRAFT_692851 [Exidia glandulosa HHB12029]|uniref:Uncharacterized protein n=1 Tax=Exidia glandulosa HHB12029 TaxID=1314781 RepID=A0A165NXB0_EXIGL|nr:hypothetical protein EXIGLDRAFT_692851 [Exidia glandulosa HHB12029]